MKLPSVVRQLIQDIPPSCEDLPQWMSNYRNSEDIRIVRDDNTYIVTENGIATVEVLMARGDVSFIRIKVCGVSTAVIEYDDPAILFRSFAGITSILDMMYDKQMVSGGRVIYMEIE